MIPLVFAIHRAPYRNSLQTRETILAVLAASPGLSRTQIIRATGISWGAVAHHVRRMVEMGDLHVQTVGRRPFYYVEPPRNGLLPLTRLLRTEPLAQEILRLLNGGPASISGLSQTLNCDRRRVRRSLAQLTESGLVGRTHRVRPGVQLLQVPLELAALLRASKGSQG